MTGPPYKCPECGVWWVGVEHRCRPFEVATDTNATIYTAICNCVYDDHGRRIVTSAPCPVHDVRVTYR